MERTHRERSTFDSIRQTQSPSKASAKIEFSNDEARLSESFQRELKNLRDMGFLDDRLNLSALKQSKGNVEAAIEYLIALAPKQEEITKKEDSLLIQLRNMGFMNESKIREALQQANGNINEAINLLVMMKDQPTTQESSTIMSVERSASLSSNIASPKTDLQSTNLLDLDTLQSFSPNTQFNPRSTSITHPISVLSDNIATSLNSESTDNDRWTVFGASSKDRDISPTLTSSLISQKADESKRYQL
jgi:hypothetical protein